VKEQLKATLRRVRASLFELGGVHARERRALDGSRAAILMYHRVLPREKARDLRVEPGMYVTPTTFRHHLEWLREAYRILALSEIVERLAAGRPIPERACALTFDDGWRDNFEHAFPCLQRAGLRATVFLVAQRVGTLGAFWPDDVVRRLTDLPPAERTRIAERLGGGGGRNPIESILDRLKSLKQSALAAALAELDGLAPGGPVAPERELLDWSEIETMARSGIEFESHGLSHALLTSLSPREAERELKESLRVLQEHGHARHRLLAYPSGAENTAVCGLARDCGYQAAVTTAPGLAGRDTDPLRLPRLGIHEDVSGSRAEFHRRVPGRHLSATGANRLV
jgi:peptidoglycan/xylan/chitin deacetylase (PgdA/CDA1 family)